MVHGKKFVYHCQTLDNYKEKPMSYDLDDEGEVAAKEPVEQVSVPMDKLAKVYRKMSVRIQELTREYETQVEAKSQPFPKR